MQIIFSTITFILIFTTLYSYGFVISNRIYKTQNIDIFFKILIGYIIIGSCTLIFHFFFKINNFFSIVFYLIGLGIFIFNYSKIMYFIKNVVYMQQIDFIINNLNNFFKMVDESDKYTSIIINYK